MKKLLFRGRDRGGKWRYGNLARHHEMLWIVGTHNQVWQVNPLTISWRFVETGRDGKILREFPACWLIFTDSIRYVVDNLKQLF